MTAVAVRAAAAPATPADAVAMRDNTLVICSGRCGSTLVADLIGGHDSVLPLVEFFGSQYQAGMTERVVSGREFWALLTEPWLSLNTSLRLGRVPREVRYDLRGRNPYPTDLSGLLAFTLPAISTDPDALLVELEEIVAGFPQDGLGGQYRRLFATLTALSPTTRWVEKSAGSSVYLRELLQMFPGVRVVYLTRDPVDVAVSMSHHPMFIFADIALTFRQRCGFDPFVKDDRPAGVDVPPELAALLPENVTEAALDARAGSPASLANLMAFQATMAHEVDQIVDGLDPGRVHQMRYEDLIAEPGPELTRLASFLDLADATRWVQRSVGQVGRPGPAKTTVRPPQRAQLMGLYDYVYRSAG